MAVRVVGIDLERALVRRRSPGRSARGRSRRARRARARWSPARAARTARPSALSAACSYSRTAPSTSPCSRVSRAALRSASAAGPPSPAPLFNRSSSDSVVAFRWLGRHRRSKSPWAGPAYHELDTGCLQPLRSCLCNLAPPAPGPYSCGWRRSRWAAAASRTHVARRQPLLRTGPAHTSKRSPLHR